MVKILVNDGIHPTGQRMLEEAGYYVETEKVAQEELSKELPKYAAICVRSATKVREELINQCPNLKVIGRGGVGLDNIDVDFAKSKNIAVVNTPSASSRSVAELVFGHMMCLSRFLHDANRQMPSQGNENFSKLKKSYAKGSELEGKTLGVIGMGRIGQETMKIGIGLGMNIVAYDLNPKTVNFKVGSKQFSVNAEIKSTTLEEVLSTSDFISLHVPAGSQPLISKNEFDIVKKGCILINAARGGVIDESAMLEALDSGILAGVGLDVFENEPKPSELVLSHPKISLSPHIGASTNEAQEKIGIELANQIIEVLNKG